MYGCFDTDISYCLEWWWFYYPHPSTLTPGLSRATIKLSATWVYNNTRGGSTPLPLSVDINGYFVCQCLPYYILCISFFSHTLFRVATCKNFWFSRAYSNIMKLEFLSSFLFCSLLARHLIRAVGSYDFSFIMWVHPEFLNSFEIASLVTFDYTWPKSTKNPDFGNFCPIWVTNAKYHLSFVHFRWLLCDGI